MGFHPTTVDGPPPLGSVISVPPTAISLNSGSGPAMLSVTVTFWKTSEVWYVTAKFPLASCCLMLFDPAYTGVNCADTKRFIV